MNPRSAATIGLSRPPVGSRRAPASAGTADRRAHSRRPGPARGQHPLFRCLCCRRCVGGHPRPGVVAGMDPAGGTAPAGSTTASCFALSAGNRAIGWTWTIHGMNAATCSGRVTFSNDSVGRACRVGACNTFGAPTGSSGRVMLLRDVTGSLCLACRADRSGVFWDPPTTSLSTTRCSADPTRVPGRSTAG